LSPGALFFALFAALTLFDAIDRALAQHPSVRSAQASVDAAHASVGEAKAEWWPSLDLTASATQYSDPMVVTPIHGFRPSQLPEFNRTLLQAGVHLESLLFDAGGRTARIRMARAQEDGARATLDEAEQQLVADVARAYLETLGQDAILRAHDQRMQALAAESTRVANLFAVGRAARVDQLRAEAELAQARAERTVAAAALDVAERELARSIAGTVEETRAAALVDVALNDAPVPSREALEQEALRENPARKRSESDLAAAQAGVPLAKSERYPSLHLSAGLLDRGSPDTEFETEWNAGLHLHLPLFTGGALRSGVRRAEALHLQAQEDLRLHDDVLREDVDRAVARIEEPRAQTAELATASSRFEEVARVSQLQVETGTGTQIDYLQAESDLLRARAAHARARYSEIAARIQLQRALGTLDVNWLRTTFRSEP
jgi:outer membrane protein